MLTDNQNAPVTVAKDAQFLANHPRFKNVSDFEIVKMAEKLLTIRGRQYRGFQLRRLVDGVIVHDRAMAVAVLVGTKF
jgi:hypothetical protein